MGSHRLNSKWINKEDRHLSARAPSSKSKPGCEYLEFPFSRKSLCSLSTAAPAVVPAKVDDLWG